MANPEQRNGFFRKTAEKVIEVDQAVGVGAAVAGVVLKRVDLILVGILGFGAGIVGKRIISESKKPSHA